MFIEKLILLCFLGKVFVDEVSDWFYIVDSNYNWIVVIKLDGMLVEVIGLGVIGI